jgi:hypothetical protein
MNDTGHSAIQTAPERDESYLETPTARVLVVDDYEPFRRFVSSTLKQRPDLEVVGDGQTD